VDFSTPSKYRCPGAFHKRGDFSSLVKREENRGMDLLMALRKLDAGTVLIDRNGKAWTAEDSSSRYSTIAEIRNGTASQFS
jgi:hypothetical protein